MPTINVTDDVTLDGDAPLQGQLYQQLSERILDGRYTPASRLPSSRQLAADLGISRNTVNAVYDQLKAEGFVQGQGGRGMFVHPDLHRRMPPWPAGTRPSTASAHCDTRPPAQPRPVALPSVPAMPPAFQKRALKVSQDASLPFQPGLPDLEAFPIRAWNRLLHHQESRRSLQGYGDVQGYRPLRQAVAAYLRASRGVRCTEDQVIITQGAQQALSLIADVFLAPGDRVFCENPGYRGARYALGRHGHELVPAPLKHQALDVDALPALGPARLLSCTPTHQYPMGGVLDLSQRLALVDWARRHDAWIIEDDYDSEFHFHHKPFAAVQGLVDQAPVLYVGSFSKTLLPALRVGYLVVPEPVVPPVLWAKQVSGGETPLLIQSTIAEFIDSGQFQRHLRRMRQLYRDKWQAFQDRVHRYLSGAFTPVAESAGMHLVLEATEDLDDVALHQWLRHHRLGSTPLSAHFLGAEHRPGLVMGFASANEHHMDEATRAMARWMSEQR